MEQNENKILLHSCCAICSGYPISLLKEEGFIPVVYFCNPNLDTEEEFNLRLDAQRKLCEYYNVELIIEPYRPNDYLNYVSGLENEPEKGRRCVKCIELRLLKAAEKARDIGIKFFTTSLSISPHKNFNMIKYVGEYAGNKYGVKFLPYDFKKKDGFLKTNKISKGLNLYRQNYCGCKFAK